MGVNWPELILQPINLWSAPKMITERKMQIHNRMVEASCLAMIADKKHGHAEDSTECAGKIDVRQVLSERGKNYGSFKGQAKISQALKDVMRNTPNWESLSTDKKEALEMNAHKVARILNGDPEYKDSWVDVGGYATLVADELND